MVGKAEGEDRLHQPGAPMDHCPESSAVPLQPLRRRIHPKRFSRASKEVLQSPSATSSEPADIAPQGSGEAAGQGPRSSAEAPREERRTILTHLSKSGGEQPGSRGRVGQWLHEHLYTGDSFAKGCSWVSPGGSICVSVMKKLGCTVVMCLAMFLLQNKAVRLPFSKSRSMCP